MRRLEKEEQYVQYIGTMDGLRAHKRHSIQDVNVHVAKVLACKSLTAACIYTHTLYPVMRGTNSRARKSTVQTHLAPNLHCTDWQPECLDKNIPKQLYI